MLKLRAVDRSSVHPAPCCLPWAARSSLSEYRSHRHHKHYLRLTFSASMAHTSRLAYTNAPPPQISSGDNHRSHFLRACVGTHTVSPCSAYAEKATVGDVHRKEREARIRKQLQQVTISPSAYDTAWVSMVPMPGSPHAPCFPQCIEWILQNQEDNGSWAIRKNGSSVSKYILLSTLACVIALKKWKLGEEHMKRGLHFIGRNFSMVMDKQTAAPEGFNLIFPYMISLATGMGLQLPGFRQNDIDDILHLREEEFERISMDKSFGTKAYIAYMSEGLGNLVDWSEVIKFQRKNGSLFNSPSTTAALLLHKYDDKAMHFLNSGVIKFGSAVPTVYPPNILSQLYLVDTLEKIGISHYFFREIKSILDMTYSLWLKRDEDIMLDFATCSIAFRLLRMNAYGVFEEEMSHLAEISTFHNSIQGYLHDAESLLELYKSSEVSISTKELILDNIFSWSGSLLMELNLDGLQSLQIFKQIEYALKIPFYATLEPLDHRWNIENFYSSESRMWKTNNLSCGVNQDLLSLAAEDFTNSQTIYQEEILRLYSWVKENKLNQLLPAHKVTYSYLGAAGSVTPHELVDARITIAKTTILATVVDDFFDGGGSKEEQRDLIELVEKWNEQHNGKIYSEKVQIIFSTLYTTVEELGTKILAVQNYDVREHLIQTWLDMMRHMMIEAEWKMNQYVATIEDYMKHAVVTIAYEPIMLPAFYLVGQNLSKKFVEDQEYNELLRLMRTIARLLNDIQGLERDEREGKLNSVSLLVLHSGGFMSSEMAKLAVRTSVINARKDLLSLVLREGSAIPKPCKEVFWKICKTEHFFNFKTGGYSSPDEMVSAVNSVLYEPLKLPN